MKNKTLRFRTDQLTEAANTWEDWYKIGYELGEIGKLIRHMAIHMEDLQKKVDSQAEELRKRQDKMAEMQEEIKEFEIQTGLMRKRTYYNRFVKEVFQKEKGSDLIYPDFDEIYKRYFELLHQREKIVEQLEEQKDNKFERREDTKSDVMTHYYDGQVVAFIKAIEIVKGASNE